MASLPPIYATPEFPNLILRACHRLAEKGYDNLTRSKKGDVTVPYITHPIIAYKILEKLGETDPITLGATLLHDGLEDCPNVMRPKELAIKNLEQAIVKECFIERNMPVNDDKVRSILNSKMETVEGINADTRQWMLNCASAASIIIHVVDQVTNPSWMMLNDWSTITERDFAKRVGQADKAAELSPRSKLVKKANFASSLLDDLYFEPKGDQDWQRHYCNRARMISEACVDPLSPVCKSLGKLVHRLRDLNIERLRGSNHRFAVPEIYDALSLDRLIEQAEGMAENAPAANGVTRITHPHPQRATKGIMRVDTDPQGNVCRFHTIENATDQWNSPVNRPVWKFLDAIEKGLDNFVTIGKPQALSWDCALPRGGHKTVVGPMTREMTLEHPIPLARFLEMARKSGVVDAAMEKQMEKIPAAPDATDVTAAIRQGPLASHIRQPG